MIRFVLVVFAVIFLVPISAQAASVFPAPGSPSVEQYGAKCDGATDDTAAFQAAAAAGISPYVPSGKTCLLSGSVTFSNGNAPFSVGPGATLEWTTDLGAGTAGVILNGNGYQPYIGHINFVGPNGAGYPGIGVAPAQMSALEIGASPSTAPQPSVEYVTAEGFYAGLLVNSEYGHLLLHGNLFTNNYYGVYILESGQDVRSLEDNLTGNGLAGIACASSSVSDCLDSANLVGTHIGFEPFCIYQEPGVVEVSGFMTQTTMIDTHCESDGNAAIRSEANSNGIINSVEITNPGFSYNSSYELTTSETTTGTLSTSSYIITSVGSTTGIQSGMRLTDSTHSSALSWGTFVVSATVGYSCNGTDLTSGQLCVSKEPADAETSDSITAAWDQYAPIETASGLTGRLHIIQGIAPFTEGSSHYIVVSNSGGGSVLLVYNDDNHGPPADDNIIIGSADTNLEYAGRVFYVGSGQPIAVTISDGSSSGSNSSIPWQYYYGSTYPWTFSTGSPICSEESNLGEPIVYATLGNSGADLIVTVYLAGNATASGTVNCIVAPNWQ